MAKTPPYKLKPDGLDIFLTAAYGKVGKLAGMIREDQPLLAEYGNALVCAAAPAEGKADRSTVRILLNNPALNRDSLPYQSSAAQAYAKVAEKGRAKDAPVLRLLATAFGDNAGLKGMVCMNIFHAAAHGKSIRPEALHLLGDGPEKHKAYRATVDHLNEQTNQIYKKIAAVRTLERETRRPK